MLQRHNATWNVGVRNSEAKKICPWFVRYASALVANHTRLPHSKVNECSDVSPFLQLARIRLSHVVVHIFGAIDGAVSVLTACMASKSSSPAPDAAPGDPRVPFRDTGQS